MQFLFTYKLPRFIGYTLIYPLCLQSDVGKKRNITRGMTLSQRYAAIGFRLIVGK